MVCIVSDSDSKFDLGLVSCSLGGVKRKIHSIFPNNREKQKKVK